jgi:tetratricopeptide (TPR) repeat protein
MRISQGLIILLFFLISSCDPQRSTQVINKNDQIFENGLVFQGMDFFGDSLFSKIDSLSQKDQLAKLKAVEDTFAEDPSLDNLIWIGRREAYLGRYDLAIRTFTKAIKEHPSAFEALRHRGHRFISIRRLDQAIADLEKASLLMAEKPIQIEADGMPNRLNIPLSNVQFNVWYHLGLAYYLKRDWENALHAYEKCLLVSDNDDLKVATLDWYYMTLMKLGKKDEAINALKGVDKSMEIIENDAYFKRIFMYKGELDPQNLLSSGESGEDQKLQYVTQGYGLGNYYLSEGDTAMAKTVFQNVIQTGYWSAFGYIASEMELANLSDE